MARHRPPRQQPLWYAVTRLRYRIGRRGACLLSLAFIDAVIGASLLGPQARAQARLIPAYRVLFSSLPVSVWAVAWIAVGALCAVQAFVKHDQWAYAAAVGIKVTWAAGTFASWLLYHAPRAWLAGLTWAVIAGLVGVINGWPEVPQPLRDLPPHPDEHNIGSGDEP